MRRRQQQPFARPVAVGSRRPTMTSTWDYYCGHDCSTRLMMTTRASVRTMVMTTTTTTSWMRTSWRWVGVGAGSWKKPRGGGPNTPPGRSGCSTNSPLGDDGTAADCPVTGVGVGETQPLPLLPPPQPMLTLMSGC